MSIDLHPGVRAPEAPAPTPGPDVPAPVPDRSRRALRSALVPAVHLLSAALVLLGSRLAFLHQSLRLDEAQSLWQTNHSYRAMLQLVAEDVHVPLYHVVLRTWRLLFGPDIETARILSLVLLLASIPVFYRVARACLPQSWALFALVLFSCSPFLQWYGNEARMYSMLVFVTLLSQHFFLQVLTTSRNSAWAGYAATAAFGAYTHYFFFFVLAAQGLYLLAVRRRLARGAVLRLAGVALLVGAALTPWYLYFRANGSAAGTRPSLPPPSSVDFSNVYSQFLFGFQSDALNTALVSTWPLLVLAALAGVRRGGKLDRTLGYLIVAAFLPVVLAFAVSHLVSPFFLSRYMISALPAFLILLLRFVSAMSRPVRRGLAAILLAVTVLGTVVQATSPDNPVQEDYRTAAQLAEQATARDVVVISSPFTIYPFEYSYDGAARVTTLPVWNRQLAAPAYDPAQLPTQVQDLIQGHQYVYLLLSYDQGYEDDVRGYFADRFEQTAAYAPSDGMQLLVFRVGYSEAPSLRDGPPAASATP